VPLGWVVSMVVGGWWSSAVDGWDEGDDDFKIWVLGFEFGDGWII